MMIKRSLKKIAGLGGGYCRISQPRYFAQESLQFVYLGISVAKKCLPKVHDLIWMFGEGVVV